MYLFIIIIIIHYFYNLKSLKTNTRALATSTLCRILSVCFVAYLTDTQATLPMYPYVSAGLYRSISSCS